jgi:hypothetical protein
MRERAMTQQFHEGQDVEVRHQWWIDGRWDKAKIVRGPALCGGEFYEVQFPWGHRAVFGEAHIRVVNDGPPPTEDELFLSRFLQSVAGDSK